MDNLLGGIKDLSVIKRYLAAINQTTDDFLAAYNIVNGTAQFFAPIEETFRVSGFSDGEISLENFLLSVHPADRNALFAELEEIRLGKKSHHDMNFRMIRTSGEPAWINSRGKVLHGEDGAPYLMIGRLSLEAVRHLFNPITGLWNRTKLREDLIARLTKGERKGWLMFLSIPSLVDINLSYGREFGNGLLREMTEALEKIDAIEEAYHIDGNNFGVILSSDSTDEAEQTYREICAAMQEKCTVVAGAVPIDHSVFMDVSQLLDSANMTLQEALESAGMQLVFFSPDDLNRRISDLALFEELMESVHNDFSGFTVYYQPQIKSGSYDLYGVEALLRYDSKERGRIFPDEFIPVLEQSGLIVDVGMWVLKTALAQCKVWREALPELHVAVNFSTVQFEDRALGEKIVAVLKEVGLPGSALTVELTESVQLRVDNHYYEIIKYIKSYGISFSIDDFGTGYSNLGYLKQLEVSEIKIDRNFVSEIEKNAYNYHLVSNMIEFARLNLIHTCCEGVETPRELSILEPLQADVFQGYLFDKPSPAQEITQKYVDASSPKYLARMEALNEIYRFNEQYGSIRFDPKNILNENNIGLWIMSIDEKNGRYGLHVDSIMERVLGIAQKLSPEDCYLYWHSRISPKDAERVDSEIELMKNGGKAVQLDYRWMHPALGEVSVRSSGIRTRAGAQTVNLEGYHRILTGVEGASPTNAE